MRISGFIPSLATKGLPEYPVTFYRPLYITRQILPAASSVMYREPSGPTATPTGRCCGPAPSWCQKRSEEHTSELQSQFHLVCRLLLEKKKKKKNTKKNKNKNRPTSLTHTHESQLLRIVA